NVSNDVWLNVLEWFGRFELGLKLAPLSIRFNALVEKRFKMLKWSLEELSIRRSKGGNGPELVVGSSSRKVPIATIEPPKSIIRFSSITIRYIDDEVISFLKCIRRLFDDEMTVSFLIYPNERRSWAVVAQEIWPLLARGVARLSLDEFELRYLRRLVALDVLRSCDKLRWIETTDPAFFPQCPPNDFDCASTPCEALSKWLHTPREDGRPKVFANKMLLRRSYAMDGLVEDFQKATVSVSYIILLLIADKKKEFDLENAKTLERLTYKRTSLKVNWKYMYMLTRCPIGRDERQWTQWEEEVTERWPGSEEKSFSVIIKNGDIVSTHF
uniref:F-box domain-containing protein n=1 Tax=Globodera pallida TaxID=36090 RepID=A0A183CFM6_GLOPA